MTNQEIYNSVFMDALSLGKAIDLSGVAYQGVKEWDSVGHMGLIAAIEEAFDIMFDTDDIIGFSSYKVGVEILKKYDVII
jgi:acyl carrier protein